VLFGGQGVKVKGLAKFLILATGMAAGAFLGVLVAPHDMVGNADSFRGVIFVGGGALCGLIIGCAGMLSLD
jgi:hypothetical protein